MMNSVKKRLRREHNSGQFGLPNVHILARPKLEVIILQPFAGVVSQRFAEGKTNKTLAKSRNPSRSLKELVAGTTGKNVKNS
jgi:hypothetical protein